MGQWQLPDVSSAHAKRLCCQLCLAHTFLAFHVFHLTVPGSCVWFFSVFPSVILTVLLLLLPSTFLASSFMTSCVYVGPLMNACVWSVRARQASRSDLATLQVAAANSGLGAAGGRVAYHVVAGAGAVGRLQETSRHRSGGTRDMQRTARAKDAFTC
jgi:hypothetical protein